MVSKRTVSIGEARRRLPAEFLAGLAELFPQAHFERILRGMAGGRSTTLRANTLKCTAAEVRRFLADRDIKHQCVPWYPDAFVLAQLGERDVKSWDLYADGRIYLQSLSSMVPALALGPRPGERVLDLAAAPGSKTTEMASLMANRGSIVANELDAVRAQRLAYNVRLQGCTIVEVRRGRGERLGAEDPDAFDRVLLDVPCSGEGRFLLHQPSTWRPWSRRTVTECSRLQRRLLASGVRAAKPGGVLLYSTCTLNVEENEAVIAWALEHLPVAVERVPVEIPGAVAGLLSAAGRQFPPAVRQAVRILPDRRYEGFFLCRLRRTV